MNNVDRFECEAVYFLVDVTSRFRADGTSLFESKQQLPIVTCSKFSNNELQKRMFIPDKRYLEEEGTKSSLQEVKQLTHEICHLRWIITLINFGITCLVEDTRKNGTTNIH